MYHEKWHYIWFNKPVSKEGRRNPEQNSKFHIGSKIPISAHNDAHLCYHLLKELHKQSTAKPAVFPSEPYQITTQIILCTHAEADCIYFFFNSKYQAFGPLFAK